MRSLLHFLLLLLALTAGGLSLLYAGIAYEQLLSQLRQPNFALVGGDWRPAATAARYAALRGGLALLALGSAGAWAWLGRKPARSARRGSLFGIWAALRRPWRALRPAERGLALGLLAVITAWRGYYALSYPLSLDEVASYDYAVVPGAALTASFYPFPNNHLLPNLLVAGLRAFLPAGTSPALLLRLLPTLLSTALLPLSGLLLLRHLRFGVVALGLGSFYLSPMAVDYAVAGRGYAWALAAVWGGLAAVLELLRPQARRRLRDWAWAGFVLSAVLGLYAMPTHAYAVLALAVGLWVGFGRRPPRVRRVQLARLALALAGVSLVAAVLYAPVGAISGWDALLRNRYVARHPLAEVRTQLGPFLVGTAAELLGRRGLSAGAYLLLLGLVPLWLRQSGLPAPVRRASWLLYAQLGLWLPLAAGQGIYPPARTLLPVLLAFWLLVALLLANGRDWLKQRSLNWNLKFLLSALLSERIKVFGITLTLLLYGTYRWQREQPVLAVQQTQQAQLRLTYAWLRAQPVARIWVEPRAYAIRWQHFALGAGEPPLPLLVVDDGLAQGQRPGLVQGREIEILAAPPRPPRAGQSAVAVPGGAWVMPVSASQPLLVLP